MQGGFAGRGGGGAGGGGMPAKSSAATIGGGAASSNPPTYEGEIEWVAGLRAKVLESQAWRSLAPTIFSKIQQQLSDNYVEFLSDLSVAERDVLINNVEKELVGSVHYENFAKELSSQLDRTLQTRAKEVSNEASRVDKMVNDAASGAASLLRRWPDQRGRLKVLLTRPLPAPLRREAWGAVLVNARARQQFNAAYSDRIAVLSHQNVEITRECRTIMQAECAGMDLSHSLIIMKNTLTYEDTKLQGGIPQEYYYLILPLVAAMTLEAHRPVDTAGLVEAFEALLAIPGVRRSSSDWDALSGKIESMLRMKDRRLFESLELGIQKALASQPIPSSMSPQHQPQSILEMSLPGTTRRSSVAISSSSTLDPTHAFREGSNPSGSIGAIAGSGGSRLAVSNNIAGANQGSSSSGISSAAVSLHPIGDLFKPVADTLFVGWMKDLDATSTLWDTLLLHGMALLPYMVTAFALCIRDMLIDAPVLSVRGLLMTNGRHVDSKQLWQMMDRQFGSEIKQLTGTGDARYEAFSMVLPQRIDTTSRPATSHGPAHGTSAAASVTGAQGTLTAVSPAAASLTRPLPRIEPQIVRKDSLLSLSAPSPRENMVMNTSSVNGVFGGVRASSATVTNIHVLEEDHPVSSRGSASAEDKRQAPPQSSSQQQQYPPRPPSAEVSRPPSASSSQKQSGSRPSSATALRQAVEASKESEQPETTAKLTSSSLRPVPTPPQAASPVASRPSSAVRMESIKSAGEAPAAETDKKKEEESQKPRAPEPEPAAERPPSAPALVYTWKDEEYRVQFHQSLPESADFPISQAMDILLSTSKNLGDLLQSEIPGFSAVGTVQVGTTQAPKAVSAEIDKDLSSWLRKHRKFLVDDRDLPVLRVDLRAGEISTSMPDCTCLYLRPIQPGESAGAEVTRAATQAGARLGAIREMELEDILRQYSNKPAEEAAAKKAAEEDAADAKKASEDYDKDDSKVVKAALLSLSDVVARFFLGDESTRKEHWFQLRRERALLQQAQMKAFGKVLSDEEAANLSKAQQKKLNVALGSITGQNVGSGSESA